MTWVVEVERGRTRREVEERLGGWALLPVVTRWVLPEHRLAGNTLYMTVARYTVKAVSTYKNVYHGQICTSRGIQRGRAGRRHSDGKVDRPW